MNGSLSDASPEVHTVDELLWLSAIPENHSGTVPHLTHHRVIGLFGFGANALSIVVLLKCKDNRNFHRLLAAMAIIDIILIAVTVLEMSIIGIFMKEEPQWYVLVYPSLIHPARGILQTMAIFMVVAVATERYG